MVIQYESNLFGYLTLSTIHKGQRIEQKYMWHTKIEATRLFKEYLKTFLFKNKNK